MMSALRRLGRVACRIKSLDSAWSPPILSFAMPLRLRRPWSWRSESEPPTPTDEGSPASSIAGDFEDELAAKTKQKLLRNVSGNCRQLELPLTAGSEPSHTSTKIPLSLRDISYVILFCLRPLCTESSRSRHRVRDSAPFTDDYST